jgi:hypothetical protein
VLVALKRQLIKYHAMTTVQLSKWCQSWHFWWTAESSLVSRST